MYLFLWLSQSGHGRRHWKESHQNSGQRESPKGEEQSTTSDWGRFPFPSCFSDPSVFLVHCICSVTQTLIKIHPQNNPDYEYFKPLDPSNAYAAQLGRSVRTVERKRMEYDLDYLLQASEQPCKVHVLIPTLHLGKVEV